MESSDEALVASAAASGDPDAQARIWRENRRWLASVLIGHAPAGADLDDLLQEVALRTVRQLGELRRPQALGAWLRRIAVNVAHSAARDQARRPQTHLGTDATAIVDPSANAHASASRQRLDAVMGVVEGLPPDLREALLLKSVHGWSQRRIADTLGVPETTVETRLARARRHLRRDLGAGEAASPRPRIAIGTRRR